jgi:hypothetical protein
VHTLVGLSSLVLVVVGGYLVLGLLSARRSPSRPDESGRSSRQAPRSLTGWSRRRDLQFVVLAAPVVGLGVSLGGLQHFSDRACLLSAPSWDYILGLGVPLGLGLIALGGLGLGVARLALMQRLVARSGLPAPPELQARADDLADRLGTRHSRVLLRACGRPLALTSGLLRPTLLLSTWMIDHLDDHELESVAAHELSHVARRDYLVIWLATVLRDAFFYLPTSWMAYRQLQREKELACDDLAVGATNRPLALASALAKVWQQALSGPALRGAQPLTGAGETLETRIQRLLAGARPASTRATSRALALAIGISSFVGLLALEATNLAIMLAPMGCGPMTTLARLF